MQTTLCYIECQGCYLMLYRNKKSQDVNMGKWIGIGGKFLPGETPEDCLAREACEEIGFALEGVRYRGLIDFSQQDVLEEQMHLFTARLPEGWQGECPADVRVTGEREALAHAGIPLEASLPAPPCNEGTLAWIPQNQVLALNLWAGDRYFLRELIADGDDFIRMDLRYAGDELVVARRLDAEGRWVDLA